ncbi:MAG: hypothetical protein HGA96_05100 [Desulfobulbaceae bacterium]|nr:hypothetical protein [Desulfobulbaceae bacterium]
MQPFWKSIYAYAAMPFRLTTLFFRRPIKGKTCLSGRYTRPAKMADMEPSADYLIG